MRSVERVEWPSLEELAESRGALLEKRDGKIIGICPLHDGLELGLEIDPARETWTCQTCMPKLATAVEWLMRAEGISAPVAKEMLRSGAALTRTPTKGLKGRVRKKADVRMLPSIMSGTEEDAELLRKIADYYHERLIQSEEARTALEAHRLDARAIEEFRLGYADKTLGMRIPSSAYPAGKKMRDRLVALGALSGTKRRDRDKRFVVPLFDEDGRVVSMMLRLSIHNEENKELWIGEKRRGLFNDKGLVGVRNVVVTATPFDAVVAWSHGIVHVTSLHGIDGGAPVEESIAELARGVERWGAQRVTLLLPRVKASERMVRAATEVLGDKRVEVLRALLPSGSDVRRFVLEEKDPKYRLAQIVRSAEWMGGVPAKQAPEETTEATTPAPPTKEPGEGEHVYTLDDRRWRVRGLEDNRVRGILKLNLLVSREGVGFHVDSFDLYNSRHRASFVKQASIEIGTSEERVKRDLGRVLLLAEEAQEAMLKKLQAPKTKVVEMTDAERLEAEQALKRPALLEEILEAFERVGVVGERPNLALAYLTAISRKLEQPLAVVLEASTSAGKTMLMDAVVDFVPEEDRVYVSSLTSQSLYYMGREGLRNKLLAVSGEGEASGVLALLQSQGALRIASTRKESSGRLVSEEYTVEGPVALMVSATTIGDEPIASHCLVLTIDESPEQTRRIQEAQRERSTLAGLFLREEREHIVRRQRNMQRLLRALRVVNPFAGELASADARVRGRRDQKKLLALVEAIALLHQHQRPLRQTEHRGKRLDYIEATADDIALAKKLLGAIQTGPAELPRKTAKLLELVRAFVRDRESAAPRATPIRFSRRELREAIGWGDTQLWTHLRRLVELELVAVHASGHGRGIVYELVEAGVVVEEIRGSFGVNSGQIRGERNEQIEAENKPPVRVELANSGMGLAPLRRGHETRAKAS